MRSKAIIWLLLISATANAQTMSAVQTVRNYSIAQKRLLVINTFQFANIITQNVLDEDSIMNMACSINGMPFLLPYNERFPGGHVTAITNLVNTGRINEARHAADRATGEMRIQGMLELSLWYLHQDGTHRQDLDSASELIQLALTQSVTTGSSGWQIECMLQSAELQYQKGNIEQSRLLFSRIAETASRAGKAEITAHAYMRMGDLLWPTDRSKENLYYKSLAIYQSSGLKEKQIELLWKIELCHEFRDVSVAEKDLREVIDISDKIGFKHKLYAQSRMAHILFNLEDYLSGIEYARAAMENMQWSGISEVQGSFYKEMGVAYAALGKTDESLPWFNKAVATGTKESHLFWYKSFLISTSIRSLGMKKPAMALSLIDSVTAISPPITVWEKMQVLSLVGISYELLHEPILADINFKQLLELANANPMADPFGEMSGYYMAISHYYVLRHNLSLARIFLKKGLLKERTDAESISLRYSLYYKIDSLEGNYRSAMQNHLKYKLYYDSATAMGQRRRMDELTIKNAVERKDQDIKLLKQQGIVQQTALKRNKFIYNIMIAGTALLLIIVGLLFSRFKLKQRTSAVLNKKNMALEHLVNEKEWLLKEVHHRVKNNLHTVISLLESQAAYLENDALKAIENSQHRIYAMSLIHQKLYQAEGVKTINMSVYLPEFIRYLEESFDAHSRVHFQLDVDPINLGVSQAIPIGLIINEAVTNSIKYAFPQNKHGLVEISMHRNSDEITLIIADNGVGIDPIIVNTPVTSLGLKLIKGLSEDIDAIIRIQNEDGTRITIAFNADPLYEVDSVFNTKKEFEGGG